jgi:hypothetical protein
MQPTPFVSAVQSLEGEAEVTSGHQVLTHALHAVGNSKVAARVPGQARQTRLTDTFRILNNFAE